MVRIMHLRSNSIVIGPINWQGLRTDLQQVWRRYMPNRRPVQGGMTACCSFCGKDHRGRRLIGGPNHLFICNECVARCQAMLDASPGPRSSA